MSSAEAQSGLLGARRSIAVLGGAVAVERRSLALSFDQRIALATLVPFVVFIGFHTYGSTPGPALWLAAATSVPHVLATFGLYLDRGFRVVIAGDLRRYVVIPLLAIPATAAAFGLAPRALVGVLAVTFGIWQIHHFTKQNLGMFSFWCRARGLPGMSPVERKLLLSTTGIGALGLLRVVSFGPAADSVLQGGGLVLAAVAIVFALRAPGVARSLALLVAVAFYLPLHLFEVDLLGAAVAYGAAHGAQYYLMAGHAVRTDKRTLAATVAIVVFGGMAILALTRSPQPWVYGLAKGVVAAHFLADASLWRLRDAGVRSLMKERFAFL